MMYTRIDAVSAVTDKLDAHDIVFYVFLNWEDEERGLGMINIRQDRTGITIDSEHMSAEFVKRVLCSLVDQAKIE